MAKKFWNPRTGRYEEQPASIISQGIQTATADIPRQGFSKQLPGALNAAQQAMPSGGSGAGGVASGALGGAATGAALGSVVPGVGTLIGAGVGALVGGVGAGLSNMEEDKKYKEGMEFKTRQQEEDEKQNRFMRGYYNRNQNMAGISQLADMRTQALENAKGRMFQDDLIRAISGR